jgi:hypothetical protein
MNVAYIRSLEQCISELYPVVPVQTEKVGGNYMNPHVCYWDVVAGQSEWSCGNARCV